MLVETSSAQAATLAVKRPEFRVSWPIAVLGCLCYLLVYRALNHVLPIFVTLCSGLGVDLLLPTRFLSGRYGWLCPVLSMSAIVLTIAKEFVPLHSLQRRLANLYLIFVGVVFAPLVVLALYLPLFELIYKLSSGR